MLAISIRSVALRSLFTVVLLTVLGMAHHANAQESKQEEQPTGSTVSLTLPTSASPPATGPLFREYKGVTIGKSADEVRQKLGEAKEKGMKQDYFAFSDHESAQIYYDQNQKVRAISINYMGEDSGAPATLTVLGAEIEPRKDGSMHKLVRYPKAGYWVSYSRTAGEAPLVTVTMQKMRVVATQAVKP